jgi:putative spermidine/putrescine transport system substrate-binding protein
LMALPSNSFLLEVTAKTYFGGTNALDTDEGILKVLEKLAEVKPNVRLWYRDEAQFEQSLKSGEIPMGQYYHDVTGLAAAEGQPVRSTFPKEGGIVDAGSWVISKASKKSEEAMIFMDYMCKPEIQSLLSRKVGTAPTLKRDLLDLTDAEFAAVSSEIDPIIPRYDILSTKADWLNEKWTEMIAG